VASCAHSSASPSIELITIYGCKFPVDCSNNRITRDTWYDQNGRIVLRTASRGSQAFTSSHADKGSRCRALTREHRWERDH